MKKGFLNGFNTMFAPAALAVAILAFSPAAALAAEHGGRGGRGGGFGGGHAYSAPRGNFNGGRAYNGGHYYSNGGRYYSGRGYYGNSARYILTGPDQITWNSVLSKNFYLLHERARLQMRLEAFNALNRSNFANPSTNINSGAFGVVTYAGAARSLLLGMRLDY